METVVVIGGGASGMMAALTAAEDKSKKVILLERQQRVGRKLLATGNGRCNLTNTGAAAENYHGEVPEFAVPVLESFRPGDTLEFFHSLGLVTVTEYGGRVYPLSNSANSVVDVLRLALDKRGVELRTGCPVREIVKNKKGYSVRFDGGEISADYLIVACGGAAGAKLGGVTDGYELLKPLGHRRTKLCPSLVQLITAGSFPRALKGIRAQVRAELRLGDELLAESKGELQFTESGVSGPAVFDISRAASAAGCDTELRLNFTADLSEAEVSALLRQRRESYPELESSELFTGMLHNRLGRMLVKYSGISPAKPLSALSDEELKAALGACREFELVVKGTEGFDSAQVTAGGIKTTGFNPETLESWFMPGLFVCGELLDVDGDCGGYNLQWAWASGHKAGRLGK
ncbi:MAG: NAD(P)/FAD-dependent oxidoreductase [Candidatus Limivicinus sp.]|jgi:predicted Rossmann fold flavoprotein